MVRCLKIPYICLSLVLVVLPLVCSKDEGNDEMQDMGELLRNLLKAEKERRKMSVDTTVDGSKGTEQERANDDEEVNSIDVVKQGGMITNDVIEEGQLKLKIIEDCTNQYVLTLDRSTGKCYLYKMNDKLYKKNCLKEKSEETIETKYELGNEIKDQTFLEKIEGIEGCKGKPVYELIQTSVTKRLFDDYEKRLAERRGCSYCNVYQVDCDWVCAEKTGWWWSEKCIRSVYDCKYSCKYDCR